MNVDKLAIVFSWNVQSNCKEEILGVLQMQEVGYYPKYLGLPIILGRSKKALLWVSKTRFGRNSRGLRRSDCQSQAKKFSSRSLPKQFQPIW